MHYAMNKTPPTLKRYQKRNINQVLLPVFVRSNKLHSTLHQIANKSVIYLCIYFLHCKFASSKRSSYRMLDTSTNTNYCDIVTCTRANAPRAVAVQSNQIVDTMVCMLGILTPIRVDGHAKKSFKYFRNLGMLSSERATASR